MIILAIETSCDETSCAIIENKNNNINLLSNIVASSMNLHSKTGGIIPEVAAREQLKYILPVITDALVTAKSQGPDIDAIAVTIGPGLIGSLLVGVETARTLAYIWDKPIIPVNHLFGHIYANFIKNENILFPALALVVSGGHTDLVLMHTQKKLEWIAGTRDDAAGEAFDKIGRLLKLPYPAGPTIEKLAKNGNSNAFLFPRPLLYEKTFDFSFSGLKAAAAREVQKLEKLSIKKSEYIIFSQDDKRIADPRKNSYTNDGENMSQQVICDFARCVQDAIIDVLTKKTLDAARKYKVKSILLGGGVACNKALQNEFKIKSKELDINFFVPEKEFCTDNAAMIGAAAVYNYNPTSWEKINANPELYFD